MNLTRSQQSYVPTPADLKGEVLLVDVKGKTLGPAATAIADLLRGKGKPFFTSQRDCGDQVVVINAAHVRLSRNKMDTKLYHWHTRYPGGFRTRSAREVMAKKPEKILFDAVWGMLPRNRLRKHLMRKLRIFPAAEHTLAAQSPTPKDL